ncbi:putative sulfate transporter [Pseudovibrio sp. Ad14]|nr:putative sulfate transporter [Pseudovibrio sp. W74]KZL05300.1 putative sulfate transporter [Pseudovibrio sp. Ad14]
MRPAFQSLFRYISFRRRWYQQVSGRTLQADLLAGFTGAAIVLPQGVAFAIIAGLPPEYGLFTAMIPAVIAAFFGSSMVMVSGPATAISAVLFTTLSMHAEAGTETYIRMALALTILVGIIQLAAGILKLGSLITFISHSVLVGFTAAAAFLIAASQLAPALGISVERGGGVFERLSRVFESIGQTQSLAALLSLATFAIVLVCSKLSKSIPSYLIALLGGTGLGWLLEVQQSGVEMFEPLGSVIPDFYLPTLALDEIATLLPGAATIAFVALLEAISIGRAFAVRRGDHYDTTQEIIGQSLSNLIGGFFKCYVSSGSFTRSALNVESGGRTPLAAIFATAFLLILLLFFAPYAKHIPVPVMVGIIMFVAWRLINKTEIHHILTTSRSETLIFSLTFFTGIASQLEFSIVAGVVTSLFIFLRNSATPHVFSQAPALYNEHRSFRSAHLYDLVQCPQIGIIRIDGPFFFGSVENVEKKIHEIELQDGERKITILNLRGVGNMDLTGADYLLKETNRIRARGGDIYLITTYQPVIQTLKKAHVLEKLGINNLLLNKREAIERAMNEVEDTVCAGCSHRIFEECKKKEIKKGIDHRLHQQEITALKGSSHIKFEVNFRA